jgi:chaperonin GroES
MAIFDYSIEAQLAPTASETSPFPTRRRRMRQPLGYRRFAGAADAIRFAIEELPPELPERPMKFRPLHDRVVVKRIDAEDKSAGGIIIPDSAKEKPSQGEVVAVGRGGRDEDGSLIPIDIQIGDRVLFGKWSGTEVKIDGAELLIMKESDIMGVVIEAAAKKKVA